jgi:Zn finger protein HypA/HybF involved in hydrogenase expression
LATNFTPTIKCHKCNKKRGLKTSKCPHCNAELSIVNTDRICIITEN